MFDVFGTHKLDIHVYYQYGKKNNSLYREGSVNDS